MSSTAALNDESETRYGLTPLGRAALSLAGRAPAEAATVAAAPLQRVRRSRARLRVLFRGARRPT